MSGEDIWGPMFFKSACNSLKASRWQLLKARLFGQRHEGTDGKNVAVGYYHGGKFYLWDYREAPPASASALPDDRSAIDANARVR